MKKLAKFLLSSIVENPEKATINQREGEDNVLILTLIVSPQDIGKVIGKNGKTIKALTSLTRIKAIKEGKRVVLEVKKPED